MDKKVVKLTDLILILITYFYLYELLGRVISQNVGSLGVGNIIFLQILADILIMCLIVFFSSRTLIHTIKNGDHRMIFQKVLKYTIQIFILKIIFAVPLMFINNGDTSNNQQALNELSVNFSGYLFFLSVIFAPIVEELVFRGIIYKYLRQNVSVKISILISSISFALLHFWYSIISFDYLDLLFLPMYLIPGMIFCIAYEKTKNIFLPIALHAFNNLLAFIIMI